MQPGIHTAIDVAAFVRRAAEAWPDRVALAWEDGSRTYAALMGRVDALAAAFAARGVGAGDRVAFALVNGPAFVETYLATQSLGAIAVPMNPRQTAREFAWVLGNAEPKLTVGDALSAPVLRTLADVPGPVIDGVEALWPGAGSLVALVAAGGARRLPEIAIAATAPAVILYTSGTTGQPKGVVRSQQALCMIIALRQAAMNIGPDTVLLATTPMFHAAGHEFMLLQTLAAGGRVVTRRSFDADSLVDLGTREGVTHAFFVPTMAVHLTEALKRRGGGWPSLKLWVSAASPLLDPIRDAILAAVPHAELWNCYGLTEGGTLAYTRHADIRRKPGVCVGKAAPAMALRVIDGAGRDAGTDTVGEIVCRSPESMLGYWRDPGKTAVTLKDGWVHSGDLGFFDDEGYLHLVGRLKDMIITGGENVYAAEVESYLLSSGHLDDVAIIGVPHPVWGEAVVAVGVAKGAVDSLEREIESFARAGLAPHKRPKRLVLRAELPKNGMGKVQKDRLRQELADLFTAGAA